MSTEFARNKMPNISEADVVEENGVLTIMGKRIPKPRVGDYILVWEKPDSSKRVLCQVTRLTERKMYVVYEHLNWLEGYRREEAFPYFHLISNYGEVDQNTNMIYGLPNIEPWINTLKTSMGDVHFFRALQKREHKDLMESIEEVYLKCRDMHLDLFPIDVEVRNPKGKWAGKYCVYREVKDKPPRLDGLILHPKEWDRGQRYYLLWHELGHAIQANAMLPNEAAAWMKAYHRSVTLSEIKPGELTSVLDDFLHAGEEYSAPNDRDEDIFDAAIEYIEDYHRISWKDIIILTQSSNGKDLIKEMWPEEAQLSNQEPEVSEYGMTNWKEFHAEAFAFYMCGMSLPERISKIIGKDLKNIKARSQKPPAPIKNVTNEKSDKKKKKKKDKLEKKSKKGKKKSKKKSK